MISYATHLCTCGTLPCIVPAVNIELKKSPLEKQQPAQDAKIALQLSQLKRQVEEIEQQFQNRPHPVESDVPISWSISALHLVITERILGRGAYGEVRYGTYLGNNVAIKKIHEVVISDDNRELFEREMTIASRVHHPNLVLFIGAETTGNVVIVTELLEMNLHKLKDEGNLKTQDIHPICNDIACALVYLHSFPDPIVHRDVRSANVFLKTKKYGWQAKLGDFSSANFLTKLGIVPTGLVAPEACDPKQQTPKTDVYSFGVLLLEVCVDKFRDQHTLESGMDAVLTCGDPFKKALGQWSYRCTQRDHHDRPNMADFVKEF